MYVGGIKAGTSREQIENHLKKHNIEFTMLRVIASKRIGAVAAKINVRSKYVNTLLTTDFWPRNVFCRRWLGEQKFSEHLSLRRNQNAQAGQQPNIQSADD